MKTRFFIHVSAPKGPVKTIGRCISIADGRDKLERFEFPKDYRRWVGEYRQGKLVTAHDL